MIQRLFVLLLLSVIVIGGASFFRPDTVGERKAPAPKPSAWSNKSLKEGSRSMNIGMTQWGTSERCSERKAHHDERSGSGAALHKGYYENHSSAKTVHI